MPAPDTTTSTQDPPITLVTSQDRLSQREQIDVFIKRALDTKQPLRLRLPLTLYDSNSENRGYVPLRDASWNFTMPAEQITPADIERLIETLGACISAIAKIGATAVIARLEAAGE